MTCHDFHVAMIIPGIACPQKASTKMLNWDRAQLHSAHQMGVYSSSREIDHQSTHPGARGLGCLPDFDDGADSHRAAGVGPRKGRRRFREFLCTFGVFRGCGHLSAARHHEPNTFCAPRNTSLFSSLESLRSPSYCRTFCSRRTRSSQSARKAGGCSL